MLDKIYIFVALIVGISVSVVMLLGDYTAKEWATTTFWCIIIYLVIGQFFKIFLKKKVFVEKNEIIHEENKIDTKESNIKFNDIESAFSDEEDE